MTAVLVTGMSGTGKSTVLAELARRGHATVDTDEGGWIADVPQADGSTEPLWDETRIAALLDEHAGGTLFVAGCVANQGRFYPRFDAVVLLSAPEDVMLERLATRTTNDFGKGEAERRAILRDLRAVEPLLRAGAGVEIDTRARVAEVADRLEALVGQPGHQTRRARAYARADLRRARRLGNGIPRRRAAARVTPVSAFGSIDRHDHLRIWDGVTAQAVEGERTTLAIVDLEPNSTVPEHQHDNEQLGVLVRGTMRFRIAGETRDLVAGDTWRILSDTPHEVTAGPEGALAVESFAPMRADWAGLEREAGRPAPKLAP